MSTLTFLYSKTYNIYPNTWEKNDQEDINLNDIKTQFPVTLGVINVEK